MDVIRMLWAPFIHISSFLIVSPIVLDPSKFHAHRFPLFDPDTNILLSWRTANEVMANCMFSVTEQSTGLFFQQKVRAHVQTRPVPGRNTMQNNHVHMIS